MSDYRPIEASEHGAPIKMPTILYKSVDGRIGTVQTMHFHRDNGVAFDAEIMFQNTDGTLSYESWRGRNMRGEFLISDWTKQS